MVKFLIYLRHSMKIIQCIVGIVFLYGSFGIGCAEPQVWKTAFPSSAIEIDQAITEAFAAKCNAVVSGAKVPFSRRLMQLKAGEIDLLSGLLKDAGRERFAYFIDPPYKRKTNKIFFVRAGEGKRLVKYGDLHQLAVGVLIGSKYFSRFDNDPNIKKISVARDESRFRMLMQNRFDALIHTDFYGMDAMYRLGMQEKIEVAPYKYTKNNPVYMAVSYNSALIRHKSHLQEVFREMVDSGEVERIIHHYFESRDLPVPEYK